MVVSVAPPPLPAAAALSAAASPFVSAAAAFTLAAPLPVSTPAALPVATALLPVGHTCGAEAGLLSSCMMVIYEAEVCVAGGRVRLPLGAVLLSVGARRLGVFLSRVDREQHEDATFVNTL